MLFCFLKLSITLQTFFGCCFFKAIKIKNDLFVAMENSFKYQDFGGDSAIQSGIKGFNFLSVGSLIC